MFDEFAQTDVPPVMLPGWAGTLETDTDKFCAGEDPHELFAITLMVPPVLPTMATIVLADEVPVHPEGRVHVYELAPATEAMLYVCTVFAHGAVAPVIFPGCSGRLTPLGMMVSDELLPDPQEFRANTCTGPALFPIRTLMELVVEAPL